MEMEPVPVSVESLDPRYTFLLDAGERIWIWSGFEAKVPVFNLELLITPFYYKDIR